ncbi:MAG TPA: serine/threonine-protein kinase, partial [Candidatus Nanopelagicales bacterium]|nr:serine/threonine-protein kinase [Candidatus Nanopelagicales bacterium]
RCHREYEAGRLCPYDGEEMLPAPRIELFRCRPTRHRGDVLGRRYQVRGYLGKGAMAKVYLAEDLETRRPVAIKVLDAAHARTLRTRERFLREARAAAMIDHPNVVRVLDVGERSDATPFLVMEYLFGESLGDWLRRERTMDRDLALPTLRHAASGLAAAHRAGIVHRDVKPDNLFLVGEPGDPYGLKVLDFGLAKISEQVGLTVTGYAVGTVEYMAPEQVVGDAPDGRTDVYALGVVMYRVFTGDLPFPRGDEDADLLAQHLLVPPPPPTDRRPGVDPRAEAVILRALRKRPENRYPSMDAFIEDLDRLVGDRPGRLRAEAPLPSPDDAYAPRGTFARSATAYFCRRLGMVPPLLDG